MFSVMLEIIRTVPLTLRCEGSSEADEKSPGAHSSIDSSLEGGA